MLFPLNNKLAGESFRLVRQPAQPIERSMPARPRAHSQAAVRPGTVFPDTDNPRPTHPLREDSGVIRPVDRQ